jgi:cellobiose phosphorylase
MLTAMLKAQRRTKDLAARKQLIFDIQRYEAEQQYYVYLACLMVTGSHQPYVKNYAANSLGEYALAAAVLDPIVSLWCRVRLAPGATARVTFSTSTLVAPSRDDALALADEYNNPETFERAVALAWTQDQLHHLSIGPDEAHLLQDLASRILYTSPTLRPSSAVRVRTGARAIDALRPRRFGRCTDRPRAHR